MSDDIEDLKQLNSKSEYDIERLDAMVEEHNKSIKELKRKISEERLAIVRRKDQIANAFNPKVGEVWAPTGKFEQGAYALIVPSKNGVGLGYICLHWDDGNVADINCLKAGKWIKFASSVGQAIEKIKTYKLPYWVNDNRKCEVL